MKIVAWLLIVIIKLSSFVFIVGLFAFSKFTEFEQNFTRHLERACLAHNSVELEREVKKSINYLNKSGLTHEEKGNGSNLSNELRVVAYRLNCIVRRIEGNRLSLSTAQDLIKKINIKKDAWTKLIGGWFSRSSLFIIAIIIFILAFVIAAMREMRKRE